MIVSKTKFDAQYGQKLKAFAQVKKENCQESALFQQSAFTETECKLHQYSSLMMTVGIYYMVAQFTGLPLTRITYLPLYGPLFLVCSMVAISVKIRLLSLLGQLYGLEATCPNDDIFLLGSPINPINVATVVLLEKPKAKDFDPAQYLETLLNRMVPKLRSFVRIEKMFGKYFLRHLEGEELKKARRNNVGVVEDAYGEQELLDFVMKLRACGGNHETACPQHYYLFPNYSEEEMALLFSGPHLLHDWSSVSKCTFSMADEYSKGYFPFKYFKNITMLQWIGIYLSFPIEFVGLLKHYYKLKPDKNCIKKDQNYMTGQFKTMNTVVMSTEKCRSLAKSKKVSLNELFLAILSVSIKEYFQLKKDNSNLVQIIVPFSFSTIPQNVKDYKCYNDNATMQVHLNLEEDLDKALLMAKKISNQQIKAFPGPWQILTNLECKYLPIKKFYSAAKKTGQKHTLLFTNCPSYDKPVHYGGCRVKRMYPLPSGNGNLATTLSLSSVEDQMNLNIISDISQIDDLPAFVQIFNQRIKQLAIQLKDQ